jgi:hypothetical protein
MQDYDQGMETLATHPTHCLTPQAETGDRNSHVRGQMSQVEDHTRVAGNIKFAEHVNQVCG